MSTTRRTVIAASAATVTGAIVGAPAASAQAPTAQSRPSGSGQPGPAPAKPTIVLVHGAFADVLAAAQRPGDVHTLGEPSGAPAWKTVPSWYLVARDDNLIPAAAQRFMARRAGAHMTEVNASHVAMISQPRATVDVIGAAARAAAAR